MRSPLEQVPAVPGQPDRERAPDALLERQRVQAVHDTGLLDSAVQESWDGLTALASRLLSAPMAFLTIVDDKRCFWLSSTGVEGDTRENTAEQSFCEFVIADRAPFVVDDAAVSLRTKDHPAIALLGVRAWAGYPITNAAGLVLGSLCVIDVAPRAWSPPELDVLAVLARAASSQVQLFSAVDAERRARRELEALQETERTAQLRLAGLSQVALELVAATSVDDLVRIVVDRGLGLVGADGGAVLVSGDDDLLRVSMSEQLGRSSQERYAVLSPEDPLPSAHVWRTGQVLQLPTRAAGLAFAPEMADVYRTTRRSAWAFAPLSVGDRRLGSLSVAWSDERTFHDDELMLLDALATQCAQALDKLQLAERQRTAAARLQELAEALQRSLLTKPPIPDDLAMAVRYLPAVQEAKVGGDWYDAFQTSSGSTLISVGDVAGHDQNAAAAMAQLRNLLRGLAVDSDDGPARLLRRLDQAIDRLGLNTLATALLARIDVAPDDSDGSRRVSWSSAGHIPPLLRAADGRVQVLTDESDLLLGLDPLAERVDRFLDLPPGSTFVLYTDGLVERRHESLSIGLERLAAALSACGDEPAETVCDRLLAAMLPELPTDDVAILVLQPHRLPLAHGTPLADPTVRHDAGRPYRPVLPLPAWPRTAPDPSRSVVLAASPQSARDARRFTETLCRGAGLPDDFIDTAVLLTSESVTNAIVHGRSDAQLTVLADRRGVRVEVADDNSREPVVQAGDPDALDGRGMAMIVAFASSWGVRPEPYGKTVWFELVV